MFWPADIISIRIRFERTVRDPFHEKLLFAFEKELRLRANAGCCRLCHVKPCSVIPSGVEVSLDSPSSRLRSAFAQSYDRATPNQASLGTGIDSMQESCQLPLQTGQCFTHDSARALDVSGRVRCGDEASLKLRRREIDTAL